MVGIYILEGGTGGPLVREYISARVGLVGRGWQEYTSVVICAREGGTGWPPVQEYKSTRAGLVGRGCGNIYPRRWDWSAAGVEIYIREGGAGWLGVMGMHIFEGGARRPGWREYISPSMGICISECETGWPGWWEYMPYFGVQEDKCLVRRLLLVMLKFFNTSARSARMPIPLMRGAEHSAYIIGM